MNILVACEYSGIVRDAFIAKGHHAVSCDILPTEKPGPHYLGDVTDILHGRRWDMLIAFPPCTHLSAACANLWPQKQADGRQQAAFDFVKMLWDAPIKYKCIENPQGWLNSNWMKPAQTIHPYHFGDPIIKRTCLWLDALPRLKHTDVVEPTRFWVSSSYTTNRTRREIKNGHTNAHARNKSFPGIADAMADQWSDPSSFRLPERVKQTCLF